MTTKKKNDAAPPVTVDITTGEVTEKTVDLDTPIQRGNTTITQIVVRKPQSGALRGCRLQALMEMDVDNMTLVLPRVTTPALTRAEVLMLDPADLITLSTEVVLFLLPNRVKSDIPTA
ncbi:phage tail assembly protein [Hafnia paralvei]|uniref:phage tail assembly protein n=1 Tax=Hafnia paralvei TaxID=546367 RepID=UPI001F187C4D|nr:phage tail assembly protein [Hafnia paralvei]MCE9904870.1 phage tail assembly protein [Hafnia paralvei]MCE9921302.1 phage tail assembly protein [Hafnia paralvei]MDX6912256.1 phage tail assembly protein [Hafnia paralvei]